MDLLFLLFFGLIYFIPSILAKTQDNKNALAIFMLNLFAGWTLIGWVGALVWAVKK